MLFGRRTLNSHPNFTPPEQRSDEAPSNYWSVLLDFIPPLLRAWKVIVVVVLVAGAVAYTIAALAPRMYASVSYVGIMDEAAGKYADSIMRSAPVLTAVLNKFPDFPVPGLLPDRRRDILESRIRLAPAKGSDPRRSSMYTLEVTDEDPARAQALVTALIDAWLAVSKPQPESAARFSRLLEATEAQTADLNKVIAELMKRPEMLVPDVKAGYFPPNVADMIKLRTESISRAEDLKGTLAGLTRDIIFSRPTNAEQVKSTPKVSVTLGAMGIALVVTVGLVILWHILKTLRSSPVYGPKLSQVATAFPRWRRRKA